MHKYICFNLLLISLTFVVTFAKNKLIVDIMATTASNLQFKKNSTTPNVKSFHFSNFFVNVPFLLKPESREELFNRIDENGDGTISFNEYLRLDHFYVKTIQKEFDQIDNNGNKKITREEFDYFAKKMEDRQNLNLLKASNFTLQRHDLNHDQYLSEKELAQYINNTLQRSVKNLHDVVSEFDLNNDGKLNLEEFNKLDFHFPWNKFPLMSDGHERKQHNV